MAMATLYTERRCILRSQCRLCLFDLIPGEAICFPHDDTADRVSRTFHFEKTWQECFDEQLDVAFHLNHREHICGCCVKETICFHVECFFSPLKKPITPAFFTATRYAFSPLWTERRRRSRYMQRSLAESLRCSSLFPSIPSELWHMVAGHLVRLCALVTSQDQVAAGAEASSYEIDISKPVYASYVKVDGLIYVKRLYNSLAETSDCDIRLFSQTKDDAQNFAPHIWVLEDHQGVRKVAVVAPDDFDAWARKISSAQGLWWRKIPVDKCSIIKIQSDGLKVRHVQCSVEESSTDPLSQFFWETPLASPPVLAPIVASGIPPLPLESRIKSFDCNHPDAVGYIVACSGVSIYDIATHKQGEKDLSSVYAALPEWTSHWMYMPLDHGEFITHIASQFRMKFNFRFIEVGLSLTTNKGRTTVFGWNADSLDTIIPVPRDNSKVFFDMWDHPDGRIHVGYLGLEKPPPHQTDSGVTPKLPAAMGKIPRPLTARALIRTACALDGISEIQPCIERGAVPRVIGLQVNFLNGHRECLGSFRLDWVAEPIPACGSDNLFVRYARFARQVPQITAIALEPPGEVNNPGWKSIPLSGILEWWFGGSVIALVHNGELVERPSGLYVQSM